MWGGKNTGVCITLRCMLQKPQRERISNGQSDHSGNAREGRTGGRCWILQYGHR